MDGRGMKKFDDGREYTGHFKLNNLDGVGEMRWPDGSSFRGSFKNNREEGHLHKDNLIEQSWNLWFVN